MKKIFVIVLMLVVSISCEKIVSEEVVSEKTEKKEILAVMKAQEVAWSNNDIEEYMQGYWKSDSLKFYGKGGLTYGWNKTLANYKRGYPTKDQTGVLKFKVNDISKINKGSYFVMGEYFLTRKVGDAKGIFMIIFKKIKGSWKIIADTSA